MKNFIKKYFRDVVISIMFVLGMSLTFFLVLNVMGIYNKLKIESNYIDKNNYSFDYVISVFPNDEGLDKKQFFYGLVDITKEFEGNVLLGSGSVSYGKTYKLGGLPIILSCNEDYLIELNDDSWVTINDVEKDMNGVYVSESLAQSIENTDGKDTIMIGNDYYEVLGLEKDYSVYGSNDSIYMAWDMISDDTKNKIVHENRFMINEGIVLNFISNKADAKGSYDKVLEKINCYAKEVVVNSDGKSDNTEFDENSIEYEAKIMLYFSVILMAFSVINCVYISNLWINRKRKELVIRKTFGCSGFNILITLSWELIKLSIISIIVSVILQAGYNNIINSDFKAIDSISNIAQIIIAMVAVVMISMVIPLIRVILIKPARGVK